MSSDSLSWMASVTTVSWSIVLVGERFSFNCHSPNLVDFLLCYSVTLIHVFHQRTHFASQKTDYELAFIWLSWEPKTLDLSAVSIVVSSLVWSGGPKSHPWLQTAGEISGFCPKMASLFLDMLCQIHLSGQRSFRAKRADTLIIWSCLWITACTLSQ